MKNNIFMENIKQKAREMFDERFGENDKVFAKTDENGLLFSMTKKDLKSFIDQIIDLAIAERDKKHEDNLKLYFSKISGSYWEEKEMIKKYNLMTNQNK